MKRTNCGLKTVIVVLGVVLGLCSPVYSQEVEPNNTCLTAQNVGAGALPFTAEGSLDSTPRAPMLIFLGSPHTGFRGEGRP
jgi:hypothetical protein